MFYFQTSKMELFIMCFVFFYYVRLCSYFSKLLNQLLLRCYKKFSETTQTELKILGLLVKNFCFFQDCGPLICIFKRFQKQSSEIKKKMGALRFWKNLNKQRVVEST